MNNNARNTSAVSANGLVSMKCIDNSYYKHDGLGKPLAKSTPTYIVKKERDTRRS